MLRLLATPISVMALCVTGARRHSWRTGMKHWQCSAKAVGLFLLISCAIVTAAAAQQVTVMGRSERRVSRLLTNWTTPSAPLRSILDPSRPYYNSRTSKSCLSARCALCCAIPMGRRFGAREVVHSDNWLRSDFFETSLFSWKFEWRLETRASETWAWRR